MIQGGPRHPLGDYQVVLLVVVISFSVFTIPASYYFIYLDTSGLPPQISGTDGPSPVPVYEPYGTSTLTMTNPGVEFNNRPAGIVAIQELNENVEIPRPHDPSIMGVHTQGKMLPFNKGIFFSVQQKVTMLTFADVVVKSDNVMVKQDKYEMLTRACHPRYWPEFYKQPSTITYEFAQYESVISLGHQHSSDFGHWFLEVLPCIAALPDKVRQNSVILLPRKDAHVIDGLETIGIPESRIVAGEDVTVFAKKLYTVDFVICGDLNKYLITNMRKMMVERFGLWQEKPTLYVTFNRNRGSSRYIANYEELREAVKQKWPDIQWQDAIVPTTLREQAQYFSRVKFMFAVHGSILSNMLFMQDNTAVVDLQMEQWLLSFLWLGAYTGKFMTVGCDPSISWHGLRPNNIDITYVTSLISNALSALQTA